MKFVKCRGTSERNLILHGFKAAVEVFRSGLTDNLPLCLALLPTATVTLARFSMVYHHFDYYYGGKVTLLSNAARLLHFFYYFVSFEKLHRKYSNNLLMVDPPRVSDRKLN